MRLLDVLLGIGDVAARRAARRINSWNFFSWLIGLAILIAGVWYLRWLWRQNLPPPNDD